jgi:pimeloyl-ACP methyl ester carboxylesterase
MAAYCDGEVELAYEVHGTGFPILLIAPGGLRSERGMWRGSPLNPIAVLRDHFQVIAMDQRNAGESTGPIESVHGWNTYTQDQLSLMSHLGHEQFAVVGMCIGGPYILNLLKSAPQRIVASAVMQTIGRDNNREEFLAMFDGWAEHLNAADPQAYPQEALANQRRRMFENELTFMAMDEEAIAELSQPMLILDGADTYHPAASSQRLAELQPQAQRIHEWKQAPALQAATEAFVAFFHAHAASSP